jgi:hypothetical protein
LTARALASILGLLVASHASGASIPLHVDRVTRDAPVTFGVPFPKGALHSPDHVRVLDERGVEVPSQITEVTSWAPADPSIQWIWVDFLTEGSSRYVLEYGASIRRRTAIQTPLRIVNSQRPAGGIDVDTGVLRFHVSRSEGGFIESADLVGANGALRALKAPAGRGSFLDLLDDAGVDPSRAVVTFTTIEKGSGPLHAILRIEGEYRYARADNRPAPFVTRIHVWAGKPWIKVLHTFVYTGIADKRRPQAGQHAHIATQGSPLLVEDPSDRGFTEPNDRIEGAGITLTLAENLQTVRTGTANGSWFQPGDESRVEVSLGAQPVSLLQTGPKPNRMPPVPESSGSTRIGGFVATLSEGARIVESKERAAGWFSVEGAHIGVAAAFKDIPRPSRSLRPIRPSWLPSGPTQSNRCLSRAIRSSRRPRKESRRWKMARPASPRRPRCPSACTLRERVRWPCAPPVPLSIRR